MAVSLKFYEDSGLTTVATQIAAVQSSDGSASAQSRVVYLGSVVTGNKFSAASDPGVDPIVISIVDSASGSGVQVGDIKLAATYGGLGTATGGIGLTLDAEILSGVANAVEVWVRIDTPALAVGVYEDVKLQLNDIIEEAVP